jgi:hypothetical protein
VSDANERAAAALRRAAEACEDYAIGEHKADIIELMALHVQKMCGSVSGDQEARLLCRLLDI